MYEAEFVIKNRAGKRIAGTLRVPQKKAKGTMIVLHGLGGWRTQYLLVVAAEAARGMGYNVVMFDAADGAKGLDGDFEHSTNTAYVEDLEDVIKHIEKEIWFVGPLLLTAHSQGGLVAVRYVSQHPTKISKLILIAPAVSWKYGLTFSWPLGVKWIVTNKHYTPGPGPARTKLLLRRSWLFDYMKFDARKDAKNIHIPVLIISGARDGLITPKQHDGLAKNLKRVKHKIIRGANHIFYKHENEVAATITKWLT